MIHHFSRNIVNISSAELPRVLYGWALWFLLSFGHVVGWTVVIAAAVTRLSIAALPLVFMAQALFTIVGMMLFSLLVDRLPARQVLTLNGFFAIVTLFVAFLFYEHDIVFLVFTLIASGMFLSQIAIILSSYLEDFFTPLEAERIVPAMESSETIGGILGGILLASLSGFTLRNEFLLIWILCLLGFLTVLHLKRPALPFYLKKLDKESERQYKPKFGWNAVVKSIEEIRRVPFLQILLLVLLFHWVIALFVEFLYTKAVDASVHGGPPAEHEASLTHGLGSLQIFFHSTALLIEFFVSSRVLRSFGTFAGFMIHTVMTLLSAFALFFGFGYTSAVLARNNFEMTSIIQKNAYEGSYYAFRYGTLRSLREFFEGIIYPVSTLLGTALILGIEGFFLERHLIYVVPFMLVSLTLGMGLAALQLQKHYTRMAVQNLYSSIPLARHHAIEIISQKGHKGSYERLAQLFDTERKGTVRRKIIAALGYLGDIRAVDVLFRVLWGDNDPLKRESLKALNSLGGVLRRTRLSSDIRSEVSKELRRFLKNCEDSLLRVLAVRALAQYDTGPLQEYLDSSDVTLAAESAICLWEKNLCHRPIRRMVQRLIHSEKPEDFEILSHLAGSIRVKGLMKTLERYRDSADSNLRLLSYYSLIRSYRFTCLPDLINLLLYGNPLIFRKGVELVHRLNPQQKRKIAHSLMPIEQLERLPSTENGLKIFERVRELYDACDAVDAQSFIESLSPGLQEAPSVS